jgi:Na+-driven multidrug efflux pump
MGVTAMIARRVGEKEFGKAKEVALQGIYVGVALSVLLGTVGFILPLNCI